MSEKKVVAFIVEGPSDESALGTIMKEYFSSNEVQFVVVHGDITLKDYVSVGSILVKINERIEGIKRKYRYYQEDFIKIITLLIWMECIFQIRMCKKRMCKRFNTMNTILIQKM